MQIKKSVLHEVGTAIDNHRTTKEKVLQRLEQGLERLSDKGNWTQKTMCSTAEDGKCQFCAIGAVYLRPNGKEYADTPTADAAEDVLSILTYDAYTYSIVSVNDAVADPFAYRKVLTAYRRAIKYVSSL